MNITAKLIESKREDIIRTLKAADQLAYSYPTCEYRVYIDTDGKVDCEEWPCGDNAHYEFADGYDRYYIKTFSYQFYDILWDYWFSDYDAFAEAFENRFGFPLKVSGLSITMYDEGMDVILAHGIPAADYKEWLGEQTELAIKEIIESDESLNSYARAVDYAILNLIFEEEWK